MRRRLGLADGVSAYRLINGEGDGLSGLSVDVYGPFAVATALSRGLGNHARALATAALAVLPESDLPLRGAVLKVRLKAQGASPERAKDQVLGEEPPAKLIVRENGVPYEVHLRGGINVGLFSDMRDHRAGLARFVRDRRVLNTFAYTGALSLAAARAGAAAVTSVDLAGGPLAWARENFRLSGLDPEDARFRWETSDVFRFLETERDATRGVRRDHPRPADGLGRARDVVGAEARLPGSDRRRVRAAARGGRTPVGLVEHAPRPERAQARRGRPRARRTPGGAARARWPAPRFPHAGRLARRALPGGLPALRRRRPALRLRRAADPSRRRRSKTTELATGWPSQTPRPRPRTVSAAGFARRIRISHAPGNMSNSAIAAAEPTPWRRAPRTTKNSATSMTSVAALTRDPRRASANPPSLPSARMKNGK